MSLFDDVIRVAEGLNPGEIPHVSSVPAVLGAIVKLLEREGIKVAEDLFPAEQPSPTRPVTPGTDEWDKLLDRQRRAVEALERQAGIQVEVEPTVPTETQPAPPPSQPAPPAPGESAVGGEPTTPPAAPETISSAAPETPSPSTGPSSPPNPEQGGSW
jgi:hypothetical protein